MFVRRLRRAIQFSKLLFDEYGVVQLMRGRFEVFAHLKFCLLGELVLQYLLLAFSLDFPPRLVAAEGALNRNGTRLLTRELRFRKVANERLGVGRRRRRDWRAGGLRRRRGRRAGGLHSHKRAFLRSVRGTPRVRGGGDRHGLVVVVDGVRRVVVARREAALCVLDNAPHKPRLVHVALLLQLANYSVQLRVRLLADAVLQCRHLLLLVDIVAQYREAEAGKLRKPRRPRRRARFRRRRDHAVRLRARHVRGVHLASAAPHRPSCVPLPPRPGRAPPALPSPSARRAGSAGVRHQARGHLRAPPGP